MENKDLTLLVALIVDILIAFMYAGILMWLWNAILVVLFNIPAVTYWQAFGIYIISNILFDSLKIKCEE